jgi:hypothetical protein
MGFMFIGDDGITDNMNLQQCLKILELENPGSLQDAKRAYKDLVRVWHPDRYQGNPRLQHKAEQKLSEINLAFTYLSDYLESRHAAQVDAAKTTPRNSPYVIKKSNDGAQSTSHKPETNYHAMADTNNVKSTGPASPAVKIMPATSSIGRYVLLAFFFIVVSISALVIYLVNNSDKIASTTRGVASEAMENILHKLEQGGSIKKNDSSTRRFIQDLDRKDRAETPEKKFEIHLDSSSIIMTEMWWEEGDMIMYKIDGGSMGIERSRVKKIVKR